MSDRLAEIEARATGATPGPWRWEGDNFTADPDSCPHGTEWADHGPDLMAGEDPVIRSWGHDASGLVIERADAEFIAHTRDDVPYLLAALATQRALVAELVGALEQFLQPGGHDYFGCIADRDRSRPCSSRCAAARAALEHVKETQG